MQDLKYEAIALDETYREITLKTSGLIPVTKAFMTNVERVYGLLRLPVAIPHVMGRIVSAVGPALVQVGRRPIHLDIPALEKPLRELLEELASVHNLNELTPSAFIGLLNTKLKALSDENSDATRDIRFLITVIINIINALPFMTDASGKTYISFRLTDADTLAWSKTFASVIALIGTPARMGFEGLLTGSIVGTWTAIEALAGDLWEAALNAEPEILSKLKGPGHRKKGKNEPDKQLDLDYIHKYHYSLRNVMGTILRKRFAFTSRDGIIEAYEAAFSRDETEVIGIVKDPVLFRLSCVRNVIVHKGGFVDEEFHRKMGKETRFSGVPIGEAITIDGEAANELIGPAVRCGVRLIGAVDDWLSSHPGKSSVASASPGDY